VKASPLMSADSAQVITTFEPLIVVDIEVAIGSGLLAANIDISGE
jgi:hypothetical protein